VNSTEDLRDGNSKYDLYIYPNTLDGSAKGYLYIDDGKTLDYQTEVNFIFV
jgi:hypothetical protein